VAQKYQLRAVYLFGSLPENEATDTSDVDIVIDREWINNPWNV
jgi:predicted nucleotidyltransferase